GAVGPRQRRVSARGNRALAASGQQCGRGDLELRDQSFSRQGTGMAGDRAGAEAGWAGGRVGPGPVQTAASRGEGDDGGPGGMRGRGGAGERDRADGKGGWAGGYSAKRQEGLHGGDDGLAGPAVCEDPGALAPRDQGE